MDKSTEKKKTICYLCETHLNITQHAYCRYPCNHVFHIPCVLSEKIPEAKQSDCPKCNGIGTKKNRYTTILQETHRSLGSCTSVKELIESNRLELIEYIRAKSYKSYAPIKLASDNNDSTTKQTKWLPIAIKNEKSENEDDSELDIQELIKEETRVDVLLKKGVSFSNIVSSNIDIITLLYCGYCMLDWMILGAKWKDLLEIGLEAKHFQLYKTKMDISSMIEFYKLDYRDILTLCDDLLDEVAMLGLSVEDMRKINFIGTKLNRRGINMQYIKQSALYKTIGEEQWKLLLF